MLEMLLFPNSIMFLNVKNPILKQLEAFASLSTRVLQTARPSLRTQKPLFLN